MVWLSIVSEVHDSDGRVLETNVILEPKEALYWSDVFKGAAAEAQARRSSIILPVGVN
jgi:hypothetical protein